MRPHGTTASFLAALIILLCATSPTPAAAAEEGEWSFAARLSDLTHYNTISPIPPLTRAHFDHCTAPLDLTPDQQSLALSLYETYELDYAQRWLTLSESLVDTMMREYTQNRWAELTSTSETRTHEFIREAFTSTDSLLADLRLLLTPAQEPAWPLLLQTRRRDALLARFGGIHAALPDLAELVASLELTPDQLAALQPLITVYLNDIDAILEPYAVKAAPLDDLIDDHESLEHKWRIIWQKSDNEEESTKLQAEQAALNKDIADTVLALHRDAKAIREVQAIHAALIGDAIPTPEAGKAFAVIALTPLRPDEEFTSFDFAPEDDSSSRFIAAVQALCRIGNQYTPPDPGPRPARKPSAQQWYSTLTRTAQPLSADQHNTIREIDAQRRDELRAWYAASMHITIPHREDDQYLSVPTPKGLVIIQREVEHEGEEEEPDEATMQAYYKALEQQAEIEQRAITRLRDILTFNQRALIANQ